MLQRVLSSALLVLAVSLNSAGYAQARDSSLLMPEAVVSGIRVSVPGETSINIRSMTATQMKQLGSLNIADALSKLPGVSQLNTGVAISKPVIRGLYGNRVLAVLSGLKFDNQQWQDEHGLGLNDAGIDRVELIKGPASLLYGSEAVGGILNIIEEAPGAPGKKSADMNIGLFSNTYGISIDAGFKKATERKNWSLRAGLNSNADYADGDGRRIVNSRFTGYYLKASLGKKKKNRVSSTHFSSSLDNFGFITADNSNSFPKDGRLSRGMGGPHHMVLLNVLSSQNNIFLSHSTLNVNAGLQSNLRMEDEGGGGISLNMLLSTALWRVSWNKQLNANTELILSNNSQFENNTNLGARIIIPNANMIESGMAGFIKTRKNTVILEAGAGLSVRNIHTFETEGVNTPDKSIRPFNKTRPSLNGSLGLAWNPDKKWNIKTNISSGFRSGNLAELSSDGLHEGTLRYEIGDPNMKIEQNINGEASFSFSAPSFQFSATGFINHFLNYIYLSPTGTQFLGFDVFRYRQANAHLYGTEVMMGLVFPFCSRLKWETNLSVVEGKLKNGDYLPFIPPVKWTHQLECKWGERKAWKNVFVFIMTENHFAQKHPALFETATPGHWLLNMGIHGSWQTPNRVIVFSISGNNLLNENYVDHLSRFKDYGIHNIGRNIALQMNIPILNQSSKKDNHENIQ